MLTVVSNRVLFSGTQIADAILFHLKDEGWFTPVPPSVEQWIRKQLPESKRVSFSVEKWKRSQTGTCRMLWMMHSANIDPFGLCKFTVGDLDTQVMHRRFSDIIDTWASKD